jgi:hypothetical protein
MKRYLITLCIFALSTTAMASDLPAPTLDPIGDTEYVAAPGNPILCAILLEEMLPTLDALIAAQAELQEELAKPLNEQDMVKIIQLQALIATLNDILQGQIRAYFELGCNFPLPVGPGVG